ncbi:MAG: hypothetical protein QF368_09825, partial [SAR202 cluster bacterium]|nr:hypothetical protein [SAR202 cluster bacterium]
GRDYREQTEWTPKQPEKNSGIPVKKDAKAKPVRKRAPKKGPPPLDLPVAVEVEILTGDDAKKAKAQS